MNVQKAIQQPLDPLSNLDEYCKYLSPPLSAATVLNIRNQLIANNVQLLSERIPTIGLKRRPTTLGLQGIGVQPIKIDGRGALITYRVQVGLLLLHVQLLSVPRKSSSMNRQLIFMNSSGTTCVMIGTSVKGTEFACKRFYFSDATQVLRTYEEGENWAVNGSYTEVESVIIEYSIAKVCSILRVGCQVGSPDHQFDLVCYEDCIQFFMERGIPLSNRTFASAEVEKIEEQLKYCLKVIHSFGIIHKDIKPDNVLINAKESVLLADFGISTYVAERPGQKSLAYKEGTYKFMCLELNSLKASDIGKVDLFYNDMWGLKCTIKIIAEQTKEQQRKRQRLSPNKQAHPNRLQLGIIVLSSVVHKGKSELSEIEHADISVFKPFFKQLHQQINQNDPNLDFLVRTLGLSSFFAAHLKQFHNPTKRTDLLIQRLQKHTEIAYSLGGIRQAGYFQSARKGYLRGIKRLTRGQMNREQATQFCEFTLFLIQQIQRMGCYQQPTRMLQSIDKYILSEHRSEYSSLLLVNQLLKQNITKEAVEPLLSNILNPNKNISIGMLACYQREEYEVITYLLRKLFPQIKHDKESPVTATSSLVFLRSICKSLSHFDRDLYEAFFSAFLECAFFSNLFEFIFEAQLENGSLEMQFLFYHMKGEAYAQVGEERKALNYFTQSYRIVCEQKTEWSFRAVYESLTCCFLRYEIGRSCDVAPQLHQTLGYLTNFDSVEEHKAVGQAHYILFRIQLQADRLSKALMHAHEVSKVMRQACQGFYPYPRFIYSFLLLLIPIALHIPAIPQLKTFLCIMDGEDQKWLSLMKTVEKFCWYSLVSLLYKRTGQFQKQRQRRLKAAQLFNCKGFSSEEAGKVASYLKDLIMAQSEPDFSEAIMHLHQLDQLLTFHLQSISLRCILLSLPAFAYFKRIGSGDVLSKWITVAIERVEKLDGSEDLEDPKVEAGICLYNAGWYKEAYLIVKSCINRHDICTYIAAECLNSLGEYSSSLKLYQRLTMNNLPEHEGGCNTKYLVAQAHRALCHLYLKLQQESRSIVSRNLAYQSFGELWATTGLSSPFFRDILRYYSDEGHKSQALRIVKCIHNALETVELLPLRRCSFVTCLAQHSFKEGNNKMVMSYLSRQFLIHLKTINSEHLEMLWYSCIELRKIRRFYQVAMLYISEFPSESDKLKSYLRARRESVKEYLLFGSFSEQHVSLVTVLSWLPNGMPANHYKAIPARKRLVAIQTLKRLRIQGIYANNEHQVSNRVSMLAKELLV